MERVRQIDPSNPASINEVMGGGEMFQLKQTPEQEAALARLETLLALVEGWVDHSVSAAVADRLPALPQPPRRCAGAAPPVARPKRRSPRLVGLELRPRRCAGAAQFLRGSADGDPPNATATGITPDLLPTAEDPTTSTVSFNARRARDRDAVRAGQHDRGHPGRSHP
jgi:uncharacterized protein (DUF2342 family)